MLQLGKDDEAYNFIKFWLKNTPVLQVKGIRIFDSRGILMFFKRLTSREELIAQFSLILHFNNQLFCDETTACNYYNWNFVL